MKIVIPRQNGKLPNVFVCLTCRLAYLDYDEWKRKGYLIYSLCPKCKSLVKITAEDDE
jgi:hypothetical protein